MRCIETSGNSTRPAGGKMESVAEVTASPGNWTALDFVTSVISDRSETPHPRSGTKA